MRPAKQGQIDGSNGNAMRTMTAVKFHSISGHGARLALLGTSLALGCWQALAQSPAAALARPTVVATAALPANALAQALNLVQAAAQALAPPQARVVALLGAPDSRLRLAPCQTAQAYVPSGVQAWGQTRIGLRCTQGAGWNLLLPVTVQVFAPALVANTALSAGATLLPTQLQTQELDWAAHAAPHPLQRPGNVLLTDASALHGRVLLRTLQPGMPLRATDLRARQWFAAGTPVTIQAVGAGFAAETTGLALAAGLEGQVVKVRTEGGRVLNATPVAEDRVQLRL
jgi:flagellar basal body P-ring formation protein FlgA